ncbi:MAG TPA: DUF2207 domain-containing protein [Actinophytocola sp.]|uniref:DUF2207 domain-containing protein n=1 Tax=Actinophytocola sp. TaxID=1872138 RepID=UPI002F91F22C
MLAKWGAAVAAVALSGGALLGAAQPPSLPSPPPDAPTVDFPLPTGVPSIEPTKPSTPPPGPRPAPLLPQSVNLALKVERDGKLSVSEQVFVQARRTMTRHQPLRVDAGGGTYREFRVEHVGVKGTGSAEVTGDELVMKLGEGASTVTYTVDGAVRDAGGRQEVYWQIAGGWDVDVRLLRASFVAPDLPVKIVCLAGSRGSFLPCSSALVDHGQVLRVVQENLPAGEPVDLSVLLPDGTVGAAGAAEFGSLSPSAFALTPVSGIGLGVLAVVLVGGFVLLWLARGRDAKALAADVGPVELLSSDGGRVTFASPDGVLPGEIGTVVDERVDAADVTATVVDLAVRNYLSVRRAGDDWLLLRRNPPDGSLSAYERAVWQALLGDAAEVSLAALRGRRLDLSAVREELYAGVVRRDWFARRPDHERTRWLLAGVVLAALGAGATVVLALTIGHALLGVAVVIGGLGLALCARFMPARTRRGSVLVRQVRGLSGFLRGGAASAVPAADREMVLSRSLPYAVVLGETGQWLARFADLDTAADGTPGLYWYDGENLTRDFPTFLRELDALLTACGQLR